MPYQYQRQPLTADEASRLATACKTHEVKPQSEEALAIAFDVVGHLLQGV